MHAYETVAVKLAAFRLRDITVYWYDSGELSRGQNAQPAKLREFSKAFLDHYLPLEIREVKVDQLLSQQQGDMSVHEYSFRFDSLARYAPYLVDTMRAKIHRFVVGLTPELVEACTTYLLNDNMDISRI
ncbi:uncharacterized protein [Nicotiana tomentosiformis]|uniref:uncharacterized protein n=1 Tax=Nicotiana tomentosiformis TaxID=4098 RepID=UPI00388CE137